MRRFLIIQLFAMIRVRGFGYRSNDDVKSQLELCMTPVVTCRAKCISNEDKHDELVEDMKQLNDRAGELHSNVHNLSGMKKLHFCLRCFKNMIFWENRCLANLFNHDYFWE